MDNIADLWGQSQTNGNSKESIHSIKKVNTINKKMNNKILSGS